MAEDVLFPSQNLISKSAMLWRLDGIDQDMIAIKFLFYFFLQRGFQRRYLRLSPAQITGQGLTKVEIPLPH